MDRNTRNNSPSIIVGDFNVPLIVADRISR